MSMKQRSIYDNGEREREGVCERKEEIENPKERERERESIAVKRRKH